MHSLESLEGGDRLFEDVISLPDFGVDVAGSVNSAFYIDLDSSQVANSCESQSLDSSRSYA